jgi:aldehyde dehydrogenase (NAD+)
MQKDLVDAIQKDLGREHFATWFTELSLVENDIDHTIAHLNKWASPRSVDTPMFLGPAESKIVYEPLGVVCVMGSWNFPIYTTLGPLVGAIAAGNTVVIKPSELAPFTLLKLKALITRWLDMQCYAAIEG